MTTPAHCTRTWRGECAIHEVCRPGHECRLDANGHQIHVCACGELFDQNVDVEPPAGISGTGELITGWQNTGPSVWIEHEPPADVAATPDPCNAWWNWPGRPGHRDHACILTSHGSIGYHVCACGNSSKSPEDPPISAPAGLSAAQQIRLRLMERLLGDEGLHVDGDEQERIEFAGQMTGTMMLLAAAVEHGPDETPDQTGLAQYDEQVMRLANFIIDEVPGEPTGSDGAVDTAIRIIRETLARADLAEARLGHIADARSDYGFGNLGVEAFARAVEAALAWTPADTATAGADATQATQDDQEAS